MTNFPGSAGVPPAMARSGRDARAPRIGATWRIGNVIGGLLLASIAAPALAQTVPEAERNVVWHDLAELPLEGQGWKETKHRYDRLPATAEGVVRPPVWTLAQDSTGMRYRFVTDAPFIRARWKVRKPDRLAKSHMAASGVSGVDLYVRDAGEWHFLAVGRPEAGTNEKTLVRGLKPAKREYLLYLPLYNGIESVEIGVPKGASFEPAPDRYAARKPIVFYGTSILQGGCASRPGMAYPAIVDRALDWPTVNLGFSGNGKTEPEMAQLLAELEPAAYVLDSLPNLDVAQVRERVEPFVAVLRAKHPRTPIILVENVNYADTGLIESRRTKVTDTNAYLRRLFEQLKAAGDKHVHYVHASHLLGGDGEDTVDGTHPTDLGFSRMAAGLTPILRTALREAGHAVADDEGFTALFDGKTLNGWKPHDGMPPLHLAGKWWAEDGELRGTQDPPGKGGLLWHEGPFKDFVLKLRVHLTYPMDTGVFVRVGPDGLSHQITLDYRPGSDVGAIFIPFIGHAYVCRNREGEKLVRPDEWNDLEIRMEGEPARIRVWLNDRLLTDFQHTEKTTAGLHPTGGIALQVHPNVPNLTVWKPGAVVRFRDIRIKELK
ncbi:MAG: SGNH/GDSL hydrolase family protein [Opitutaceae bacterium]|nr:SGNH/GDSL hydrolase family protein [Opitutaceae bacterium]